MTEREGELDLRLRRCREEVDREIERLLGEGSGIPERLRDAMGYSLRAGGKRLRPFLCIAAAELSGCPSESVLPMAAALEMFHTASLIHDDLPCMDDDPLRRGKPSNHMVFGEGLATLAGDSLLLWAFETAISNLMPIFPAERVLGAIGEFAKAIGPSGVCGGQVLDTDPSSRETAEEFVWKIASLKTGALIRASVLTGGILGGLEDEKLEALYNYGTHLGLAFQVVDDILDVTGESGEMGKTPGKDSVQGKVTFVSTYGLEKARSIAREESLKAIEALSCFGQEADHLRSLARILLDRSS
jgi:geranylgeranyl diphosphate synthase type II